MDVAQGEHWVKVMGPFLLYMNAGNTPQQMFDDAKAQALHTIARALPARYKRLEWLDLREGKLPNPDVEYPDLGEPAAFACSNRICSFPSFNAEELQATVKQMAKLKPTRAALN